MNVTSEVSTLESQPPGKQDYRNAVLQHADGRFAVSGQGFADCRVTRVASKTSYRVIKQHRAAFLRRSIRTGTVSRFLIVSLFLVAVVLLPASAQDQGLPVEVDLDAATFAYDDDASLVELYLAFEAGSLHFVGSENGFTARLPVELAIRRDTDAELAGTPVEPLWQDSLRLEFSVLDTTGFSPGQHFVHQVRAAVPSGEYVLELVVPADAAIGRSELMLRRDLLVAEFAEPRPTISDIVIASSIQPSEDSTSPFHKNGLLILPNANQVFGVGLERLYYYAEIYRADMVLAGESEYNVFVYLAEANLPQPMPQLQKRFVRAVRNPDVVVGSFDLSAVPSGSYYIRAVILNRENESIVEQSRKFFVYNPGIQRETTGLEGVFESSLFATLPEEQVEREMDLIGVIATDRERGRIKSIQDLEERRRFLMTFWEKRDPQATGVQNQARQKFLELVQYATERYSTARSEGWETDRGQTVLKYGLPSENEPHLYDSDTPYEIWRYNNIPGEGQGIFVFADRTGFGRFELLHSTVRGEPSMPNWQQELTR
jgi:GWxTD domain-containing protein